MYREAKCIEKYAKFIFEFYSKLLFLLLDIKERYVSVCIRSFNAWPMWVLSV